MLKLFSFCVVFLCYGSQYVANGQCSAITNGGYLGQSVSISPFEGPCSIYDDLFVPEKITLTLLPGSELRFGAGVMLAVNGTLIARGQPDRRIVLTKLNTNASDAPSEVPSEIRLVDEFSVSLGRLQLFHRNKWRGVCANNVNWTQADTDVACRQLGFAAGNFSFGTWARNDSSYLLFYSPSCRGNESSVLDCPRSNLIKIGTNICRGQQTVYLRCFGISPSTPISDYWWGLEFYNTTYIPTQVGNVETNDSTSAIEHVDILYAGVTKQLQRVPALRADPTAPSLVSVVIKYSALDGVNFTNLMSPTVVNNVTISHSRGHGMNVESLLGRVNITNSIFTGNQGNGFKVKFLDRRFQIIDRDLTFCSQPNIPNKFPQIITGIPGLGSSCGRRFTSYYGLRLTLNVLEMDIEPAASASVEIFDGYDETSRKIGSYDVVNGSFPMGVTTTLNYMFVKFSWVLPSICPSLRFCVKITMIIDTYKDSMPELYMNNTISSNNLQHGLYIENVRNYVMVNSSQIVYNGYGAGVRIFGGAGDVLINSSLIEHNVDSGVNITYDGGWRIFNLTSFSHNLGPGINVTFNRTSVDNFTRYTRIQQTHVSRSTFVGNEGYGIQVGNYCLPGNAVVVNDSYFSLNSLAAVQLFSCFRSVPVTNGTNFTIAYNKFDANREHAIKISPLINAFGRISNNTFTNHPKYVLLLDNTDDFLHNQFFLPLSTSYEVWGNSFANNRGHYVANFRLSQGSGTQNMTVMYNVFRDNNLGVSYGNESSDGLNYRYRVSAVVFVSSSNVFLVRNHLENPKSPFEVATQLDEMNIVLDASRQWWSTTDYRIIINRIFDQYSRFNLARISYHPALDSGWLWTPVLTDRSVPLEVEFLRGNKIGGRLLLDATLESGQVYRVDRDVSVLLGGRLFIEPGVRLQFSNCLSMSVEGYAKFLGSTEQPIAFESLPNETTWINSSLIRLVDGDGVYSGRLQVRPSEMAEWGTICREGWSLQDAMLACNQMGLVVDLDGWQFGPLLDVNATISLLPIYRSYVQCTAFDISLLDCIADSEFDHSCDHTQDVYLKCLPPSWGGIRFLSTAVPSVLDTITITGGGYDDPMARYTVPALQIDYNLHSLNSLIIQDNRGDGILVYHNDVLANSRLVNSYVRRNGRNGVSVRSSFFELLNCVMDGNGKAGFDFNPSLTTEEALLLRSGITRTNQIFPFDSNGTINIDREEDVRWILTPRKVFPNNSMLEVEVQVRTFYKVVLDLIDYNPISSQEEVRVYEGRRVNIRDTTSYWSLINDTVDFPIVSQLNFITIRWFVANTSSGRLTMFVRSRHFDWLWPFPVTAITNTSFIRNGRGIATYQYNQPSNEFYDLFTRHQWTKIYCTGSTFDSNKYEAIYVASVSRYNVLYLPNYRVLEQTSRVAEIEFQIERCTFKRNGLGVVSEHLNVEFSSNVWVWNILDNLFEENLGGGMSLYLPRVNLLDIDLYNHSVNMNGTTFRNNSNFEFRLAGFYCNSTISNNIFRDNECWPGCFSMAGTEKDFEVVDNRFERNAVSRYVVEMNMNSHTPYTQWVDAKVSYNLIQNNFRLDPSKRGIISSPLTYAFGMLGVQNVSINRNLFGWNDLDVEFLAGQTSSSLENYLDVTLNYWGTTDQMKIMQVIFDFDDWNSFSIAEYHPFLISNNFDSFQYVGPKFRSILDLNKPLGGRISENLVLKKRDDPYLVVSDLTVMPGYQLVIEAGVQMLFYPNVGILSLGSLSIIGNKNDRISFGPVPKEVNASLPGQSESLLRKKVNHPDIDPSLGYQIRLVDGKSNKNEGFIEIYNNTEKRWSLVCDDGFNERTSEVFCRSMGFEASNSAVFRSPYYDIFVLGYPHMHEQLIEWYWRESFICDGRESGVEECRRRINYALPECMVTRRYVFVRCGPRNIPDNIDYWGSIRFNLPTYESGQMTYDFIRMEQVNIYGAGRLHGKRSAAIEGIFRTPETSQVTVQNCLWNAIEYVAAIDRFLIADNVIQNNNGFGIGIASLNGQSTDAVESAFVPLVQNRVPYDAYGFIRMCTVEKLVKVTDRSLLYFKYDFETVDCVKIVRSRQPRKQIGVRFLQVNLFNDTMYENAIELYNSEFIEDSLLIGRISPESSLRDLKRFYVSGSLYDTITVRMKASPGYRDYGFVAEVVTIPISGLWRPNIGANQIQQISRNLISKNEAGGFFFHNVGENNMRLSFESNYVTGCGLRLLNITMPGALDVYIQNTKLMTIANNYVDNNAGGVYINTTTRDNQVAIYANITNNIITRNTHAHAFYIEGHRFQGFDVRYNYIAFNDVDYRNIFSAFGVQLNFTYNVVYNNTGQCIMNASVEELVSVTQQYTNNAIYYNWASSFNRSTFFLKSAQFKISYNYLLNPYNIYEIAMFNRTKYMNDEKGLYPSVAATNNWWGRGERAYVAGRIWDRRDDENLIQVDFEPFFTDNSSVLEGKCYPGWKLYGTKCYWYFGGAVPYSVADKTCRENRARIAWARNPTGRETALGEVISQFQFNYDARWQTWVFNEDNFASARCTSLQNYVVGQVDCRSLLPFICEKTPYIIPYMNPVPIILAAVISGCILLLVVAPLSILAIIKSLQRKEEKSERKELLRESFRNSRRSTVATISNEGDGYSHYDKSALTPNQFINISGVTLGDSSTDLNSKVKIPSSSTTSSNFKINAGPLRLKSSDADSDVVKINGSKNHWKSGVENEISYLSPSRYVTTSHDLSNQSTGATNRGFRGDEPRVSIPPPYREDWSSNGVTGMPDLGTSWVTRTAHRSTSSNGIKSPSVRFSPTLKFQASESSSSSDEKRGKPPRPPLDVTFI